MIESNAITVCPACGEPIQANWKFCPACETSLIALACPQCKIPVKENWKRCPECEARLVCKICGKRILSGYSGCPACEGSAPESEAGANIITEPATGMEFVKVPGGAFKMGDTFDEGIENEKPVHAVQLEHFYMGNLGWKDSAV